MSSGGANSVFVELQLNPVRRADVEAHGSRLFAAGAVGLQEDWLEGEAPPPRQPWDTGPAAPEPDRVLLRAWFEEPDRAAVEAALAGIGGLRWVEVEDRDWDEVWKEGFAPIEVAPGWVVAPPWNAPPGALIIEPGQGFGTGHHPSTIQALRHLLAVAEQTGCSPGGSALDVGCGSGILALAAARLGLSATGVDVEEAAIRDADRNAALNQLTARFSTTPVHRLTGTFDLVLANLHAELLVALAPELARLTGSRLITAGVLADREERVEVALAQVGLVRVARDPHGEWVSSVYRPRG